MTSTLALVSLFTEVFAAGMVVAGLTSFATRAIRERSVLDGLRTALFVGILLYILSLIVAMVMTAFGGTPEGHRGLEWLKVATLILLMGLVVLLMITQYPGRIVPTRRGSLLFISGLAAVALALLFVNPHMIIRPGLAEPFSMRYLPVRLVWQVVWGAIGILAWRRSLKPAAGESAALWRVLAVSGGLFMLATSFREAYWVSGQDIWLLSSSLCRLVAITGLLLSQFIHPGSDLAQRPLKFFQTKLLYRLLLLFVFLIVALFGVTTILASGVTKSALSRSILAEERSVALELASQINSQMDTGLEALRKGVTHADLRQDPRAAMAILLETFSNFDGLVYIRPGRSAVSVTRPAVSFSETEIADIKIRTGQEFGYRSPLYFQKPDAYFIAAYTDGAGTYLAGRINLRVVRFLVDEITYGRKSGSAYVVDERGQLIAGPRLDPDFTTRSLAPYPWVQAVLKGYVGGDEYINHDGDEVVGSYVPVRKMGWGVLVERPRAEAYAEISDVQGKTLFVTLLGILIAILAGVFFAGSIERSIVQLIEGTREVRKGNLNHHIHVDSHDEIGQLADAFNQMTAELRESQEHLISSEKFAAMGTMATGMAHEIKNPLVSLRTFAQLLPQRWHDEEFRRKFALVVPNEVDRISKIADNLLRFGRPAKPEFAPTNVNDVFGEVLSLLEPEFKKANVKVTTKFADLPKIRADASQLSQVFLNLFLNAVQAMPQGGDLIVKTDVGHMIKLGRLTSAGFVEEKPASSEAKTAEPQAVVFIEITDTGTGIPEENLKNLFDPFFTTKDKGTGMGLPISLRIIEEHRGTIRVRSRVGKGTTFVITLPQENA